MSLKVVEEQRAPATTPAGEPGAPPRPRWASIEVVLVGLMVARFVLDLAWRWQSGLGSEVSWHALGSSALVGAGLLPVSAIWCRRLGGDLVAQLATALAVFASPALWMVGWGGEPEWVLGFAVAASLPLLFPRNLATATTVWCFAALAGAWVLLSTRSNTIPSQDSPMFGSTSLWSLATLGPMQIVFGVAVFWFWLDWAPPSSRRSRSALRTQRGFFYWTAVAALFTATAFLGLASSALATASFMASVAAGLIVEVITVRRARRTLLVVVLLSLVLQLAGLGWWMVFGIHW